MSAIGFVLPVLSIGLGAISIRPKRGFFPASGAVKSLVARATLREMHRDVLEISDHPIEQGAAISDHAFKRPAEVVIECGWSNTPSLPTGIRGAATALIGNAIPLVGAALAALDTIGTVNSLLNGSGVDQVRATYQQLLELQASRIPFDIYTGKRVYKNMLFRELMTTTESGSENNLIITATCRQVLLVATRTITLAINTSAQAVPAKTSPTADLGQKALNKVTDAVSRRLGTGP